MAGKLVTPTGIEGFQAESQNVAASDESSEKRATLEEDSVTDHATVSDGSRRAKPEPYAVEDALAAALQAATDARRWEVVGRLAEELQARRLARSANVIDIGTAKRLGARK
jgi:hypothetical protein